MVIRLKRVGHKVAFAGCKLNSGVTGALHSYWSCVEVGGTLEGGLAQRSGLVPMA